MVALVVTGGGGGFGDKRKFNKVLVGKDHTQARIINKGQKSRGAGEGYGKCAEECLKCYQRNFRYATVVFPNA